MNITHRRSMWLGVVLFLVAGGLLGGALETEGACYQDEARHCMTCCTTHHTVTTHMTANLQVLTPSDPMGVPSTSSALCGKLVIRLLDPPPKFLT